MKYSIIYTSKNSNEQVEWDSTDDFKEAKELLKEYHKPSNLCFKVNGGAFLKVNK